MISKQSKIHHLKRDNETIKNLYNNLKNQNVQSHFELPVHNYDRINVYADTDHPISKFHKYNNKEFNGFDVYIKNNEINLAHKQTFIGTKCLFDTNKHEQKVLTESKISRNQYTLKTFIDKDTNEQFYCFVNTDYINSDDSIRGINEPYALENIADNSLMLRLSDMNNLTNQINDMLNLTNEKYEQNSEHNTLSRFMFYDSSDSSVTTEYVDTDILQQIDDIQNRLYVLNNNTYIPIERRFTIESDGIKIPASLTTSNNEVHAQINNLQNKELKTEQIGDICNQVIEQIDLCNDLINAYDYLNIDTLDDLDSFLSENGHMTNNLQNALQEHKNAMTLQYKAKHEQYDYLDSYEKLLNFEGLDDELQK